MAKCTLCQCSIPGLAQQLTTWERIGLHKEKNLWAWTNIESRSLGQLNENMIIKVVCTKMQFLQSKCGYLLWFMCKKAYTVNKLNFRITIENFSLKPAWNQINVLVHQYIFLYLISIMILTVSAKTHFFKSFIKIFLVDNYFPLTFPNLLW